MRRYIFAPLLTLLFLGSVPAPQTQAESVAPVQVPQANELAALTNNFFASLNRGDFVGAEQNFTPAMKASLPPDQLQKVWQAVLAESGSFKQAKIIDTAKVEGNNVLLVRLEFSKETRDVKVVFDKNIQLAGLFFTHSLAAYQTPTYVELSSFAEKEVQIGTGQWALPGTLTLPVGAGPFPAIVLVHGSGPQDRDSTIGANKPLRDLAWGLASQGIAVLRYEKRTKVHPQQFTGSFTVKEETVDDAIAAVTLLRQTKAINPQKIFVLGHSLGGMLIPRIGMRDAKIAGLIVMAGNTRPFEDLFLEQVNYIAGLDGVISPEEKVMQTATRQQVAQIKDPKLAKVPPTKLILGAPPSYWLDLRTYSPSLTVKALQQPLLILQGERDYQVTLVDFRGWQKALAGKKNVIFRAYPKLNHLFISGIGKSVPDEYQIPGQVEKVVVDDIASWVKRY